VVINKIIYFNESTGMTELCSPGDVHNISDLNIYGRELIPQRHLEKLILDKKITYTRFSKGQSPFTAIFVDTNKYPDRLFSLEFNVAEINNEYIVVNCSERVEATNGKYGNIRLLIKEFPNFAKIKFIKRKNININGCVGDAAIVIYDVGVTFEIAYTNPLEHAKANLGRFALSIGLSLFVEMDGDWNKIIEDSNKHLMPVSEKLSNAKKENAMLKEENISKEIEIQNLNQEKSELNSLVKEMEDIHKDDNIDFSPMLLDFAKCLEDVLAKFLIKKLVIPEYEKPMLGNSLIYIKKNQQLTGLTRTQTKDLAEKLQAFIYYRNDVVHKERVTLDDVLKAKDILLGELNSYSQNYLLDFIHSYY
jgi:hypothetical protein